MLVLQPYIEEISGNNTRRWHKVERAPLVRSVPRSPDPRLDPTELRFSMSSRLQDLTIEEEDDEREEVSTLHDYPSEISHPDQEHLSLQAKFSCILFGPHLKSM